MITSWTITKDNVAFPGDPEGTNGNAVTLTGPSNASLNREEILNHPDKVKFQMFDDDGELYYEGFMVLGDDEAPELRPLNDFGKPNAGATEIRINGKTI